MLKAGIQLFRIRLSCTTPAVGRATPPRSASLALVDPAAGMLVNKLPQPPHLHIDVAPLHVKRQLGSALDCLAADRKGGIERLPWQVSVFDVGPGEKEPCHSRRDGFLRWRRGIRLGTQVPPINSGPLARWPGEHHELNRPLAGIATSLLRLELPCAYR